MIRILTEPKNSLTKQYEALLAMDHVDLHFTRDALEAIADKTMAMDLGARGLRSIMENLMRDIMFQIPSDPTITEVEITAACVRGESQPRLIHAAKEIAG
jgi:ATP-dependent Clp protease ATP-binding subunit ClpX